MLVLFFCNFVKNLLKKRSSLRNISKHRKLSPTPIFYIFISHSQNNLISWSKILKVYSFKLNVNYCLLEFLNSTLAISSFSRFYLARKCSLFFILIKDKLKTGVPDVTQVYIIIHDHSYPRFFIALGIKLYFLLKCQVSPVEFQEFRKVFCCSLSTPVCRSISAWSNQGSFMCLVSILNQ